MVKSLLISAERSGPIILEGKLSNMNILAQNDNILALDKEEMSNEKATEILT